ncbi:MAG: hypothetical protein ACE5OP_14205, partial [Candidatus Glassbacteria bacterium]
MKTFVFLFLVSLIALEFNSAFSIDTVSPGSVYEPTGCGPILFGTGGPDDYGYTWIDGDEPGGPTFQWVDITGIGTLVEGLADDNSVGPFLIGFEFPYYWYTADRFYVGSNGWISFSSGQNYAHPFNELPNPTPPNDLLACLAGDIDFTQGGSCYYYTSPGLDSFVVSYIDVPEYADGSTSHTFQIVLTRSDSTITYQYAEQVGDFSAGGSNAFSMGMENNTGTIGLSYYYNDRYTPPPVPPPFADSTVIKFIPPESTTYEVDDIGVLNALTEGGMGIFVKPNSSVSIWSDVKNFGNQAEESFTASCEIEDIWGSTVYEDTLFISTPIDPGEIVTCDMPSAWTVGSGTFSALFGAHLPPGVDMVPGNDYLEVEVHGVSYPGVLFYDDASAEELTSWTGDFSGFGNEFVPPSYPARLDEAMIYVGGSPGDMVVYVLDDDGPDGAPGTILAGDTVYVSTTGWITVDFTDNNLNFWGGSFFIGAIHRYQSTITFGMDQSTPLSRRGWEYTGSWAHSRYRAENDIMIRAVVSEGQRPHHKVPVR